MTNNFVKIKLSDGRVIQDGQIEYIIAKNGIFKRIQNNVIDGYVRVDNVPFLPELDEKVKVKIPAKIPYSIYLQVYRWFCGYSTEVYVQIFWDERNKRYFVHVPHQVVGNASVNWKDKLSGKLQQKYRMICEIHSHNTMGHFFSGIDNGDEKGGLIYGVMSTTGAMDSSFRIKIYDTEYDIDLDTIFDMPPIPKDWNKSVKTEANGNFNKKWCKGNEKNTYQQGYLNTGGVVHKPGSSTPGIDEHYD